MFSRRERRKESIRRCHSRSYELEWISMPRFRVLDYPVLILAAALVAASVSWSAAGRGGGGMVEIEASGRKYLMPLSADGRMVVEGPVGKTVVEVRDGVAAVTDSDCRDKVCVAMGGISEPSGWIACLPNRVFVRIVDEKAAVDSGGADAVVF